MASSLSTFSGSTLLLDEIVSTFEASLRSVGTACTLAAVGVYLHRRQFVVGDGKRTLALISQQVTIPLLFFTKILFCNQDWSDEPCPDVTQSLRDVWVLLLWPVYVVGVGLAIGYAAAKVARTPQSQLHAVLVACAFGNSTGLPITLLTVVHSQFPADTDLGRMDPTLFLSVYLLMYPVLQWGIGGWLLAQEDNRNDERDDDPSFLKGNNRSSMDETTLTGTTLAHNVLNVKTSDSYNMLHRGMGETDASMYMSVQENLHQIGKLPKYQQDHETTIPSIKSYESIGLNLEEPLQDERTALLQPVVKSAPIVKKASQSSAGPSEGMQSSSSSSFAEENEKATGSTSNGKVMVFSFERRWLETLQVVFSRCLQPPVVGALLGMFVASMPRLRGLLVDLVDRSGHAPLQWMFDGLYSVGESAVPINMMILGSNLSASFSKNNKTNSNSSRNMQERDDGDFSPSTMVAIVVGKMIIMPIIGFLSAYLLKTWWWEDHIPDAIGGSFYLVIMIVFLTPTANNVMVMVELSGNNNNSAGDRGGGGTKEAMARIIAWQYAVSPVILSLTMTVAVCIAVQWS